MNRRALVVVLAVVLVPLALAACHTTGNQRSTAVLDYLYPRGSEETPPHDVSLTVERVVEQPDGSVTRTYGSGALSGFEVAFVLLLLAAGWRRV